MGFGYQYSASASLLIVQKNNNPADSAGLRYGAFRPQLFADGNGRLEFIIDAAAGHVLVNLDVDRGNGKAIGQPAGRLLETDGHIFGLRRPIVGDGDFDTDAGAKAQFRAAGPGQGVERSLDVGNGAAACRVEQHPVHGEAEAGAERANPVAGAGATGSHAARQSTVAADQGASDVLPVDVALGAEDNLTDLVIAAERDAGERTVDVEISGRPHRRGPIALTEGVAGIEADVDAGPAESRWSRNIRRRSLRRRHSRRRQVGGKCGSRKRARGNGKTYQETGTPHRVAWTQSTV